MGNQAPDPLFPQGLSPDCGDMELRILVGFPHQIYPFKIVDTIYVQGLGGNHTTSNYLHCWIGMQVEIIDWINAQHCVMIPFPRSCAYIYVFHV